MLRLNTLLIFILCAVVAQAQPDSLPPKKILFVATNVDKLGTADNGTFLVEIVYPFQFFKSKGYSIDIVTPQGKSVPIYWMGELNGKFIDLKNNPDFHYAIHHTLRPAQVKTNNYAAVYIPGGYGQFFDVCTNDSILNTIAAIYEKGAVLGTAGHGAAALCNIKLSSGAYLVKDKTLTCFPWNFESSKMPVSNYGKLLPFNMQEVLKSRGANLIVCTETNFTPSACRQKLDVANRLVTGAFADDCLWVAEEMEKMLRE